MPWTHRAGEEMFFMRTIALLILSNSFMTLAWYGHLKHKSAPLWAAILASWGIAFFEYCFQVPANRIGSYQFSTIHLKTIQEIITLVVFCFFSYFYLNEPVKINQMIGFVFIVLAAFFIFKS